MPEIIGEDLLARDPEGKLRVRIATAFPRAGVIVTTPGIHATQRVAYVDAVNRRRAAACLPPLTEEEEVAEWMHAVDLVLEDDTVLIRPDPQNMPLAFEADEMLQQIVSKKKVRFLHVMDPQVRAAIERRGERWRISPLPRSPAEMMQMIAASRTGIGGRDIYYYNKASGTRILTYQEFCGLSRLDDAEFRRLLAEVREYSARSNRMGHPEVDFFMAVGAGLPEAFAPHDFLAITAEELGQAYGAIRRRFHDTVPPEFRTDDLESPQWRGRMFAALIGQSDKAVSEEALLGLSAEFFMQVEWLPGGRIEDGELILDSVFDEEADADPARRVSDEKARGFIFNFIRDYGELEYVNVGRVVGSLSTRQAPLGRRAAYLAEIKQRGHDRSILRVIRMQKWGVREHLDEGKDLLAALLESEGYTDYILDRRLGCRQLGMNVSPLLTSRKVSERYTGRNGKYYGTWIWSTCFERDYVGGLATDKIPGCRFEDGNFAVTFARLLGGAAAPNLIVGRADLRGNVIFDDGDELVIVDAHGLPSSVVVADHTGTFGDYQRSLSDLAPAYAESIARRAAHVPDVSAFREAYLTAFAERFTQIQQEYRRRRRAFDTLFRHERRDEAGSFAYRWERVLARLDASDPKPLAERIRSAQLTSFRPRRELQPTLRS